MSKFALPKTIKVGPFIYKVIEAGQEWRENHEAHGLANVETLKIFIHLTGNNLFDLDTLIHEIFHAMYGVYKLSSSDDEERVVSSLSTALFMVLTDNPELRCLINSVLLDEED